MSRDIRKNLWKAFDYFQQRPQEVIEAQKRDRDSRRSSREAQRIEDYLNTWHRCSPLPSAPAPSAPQQEKAKEPKTPPKKGEDASGGGSELLTAAYEASMSSNNQATSFVVQGESVFEKKVVGGKTKYASKYMPDTLAYDLGTMDQPLWDGFEGVAAIVWVQDWEGAILHFIERKRGGVKSGVDPQIVCEAVLRALRESFAGHPVGRDWCERELAPEMETMISHLPAVQKSLEADSIRHAIEFRQVLAQCMQDEERLEAKKRMFMQRAHLGDLELSQAESWVVSEASRPLYGGELRTGSGVTGTPGSAVPGTGARREGTTGTGVDIARPRTFKDVMTEFDLPKFVYLVRDEKTGTITRTEFMPWEALIVAAGGKIKKELGGKLTDACCKYYATTQLHTRLDGSHVTNDTYMHFYRRLKMFLTLKRADELGITVSAIYQRILQAVRQNKALAETLVPWNIQHNEDSCPEKLAKAADKFWKKIEQEQLMVGKGVTASITNLSKPKDYAMAVQSMSDEQKKKLHRALEFSMKGEKEVARTARAGVAASVAREPVSGSDDDEWMSTPVVAASKVQPRQVRFAASSESKEGAKSVRQGEGSLRSTEQLVTALANLVVQAHGNAHGNAQVKATGKGGSSGPSSTQGKQVVLVGSSVGASANQGGQTGRFMADGTIICDACHQPGHKRRDCPQRGTPTEGGRGGAKGAGRSWAPSGRGAGRAGSSVATAHVAFRGTGESEGWKRGFPGLYQAQVALTQERHGNARYETCGEDWEDAPPYGATGNWAGVTRVLNPAEYLQEEWDAVVVAGTTVVGHASDEEREGQSGIGRQVLPPEERGGGGLGGMDFEVWAARMKEGREELKEIEEGLLEGEGEVSGSTSSAAAFVTPCNNLEDFKPCVLESESVTACNIVSGQCGKTPGSVMSQQQQRAAKEFSRVPAVQLRWDKQFIQVVAQRALEAAQYVAGFYDQPSDIGTVRRVLRRKLGEDDDDKDQEDVESLLYENALLIGYLAATVQVCDLALVAWSLDLALQVFPIWDEWAAQPRPSTFMQQVNAVVAGMPEDAATRALRQEWEQMAAEDQKEDVVHVQTPPASCMSSSFPAPQQATPAHEEAATLDTSNTCSLSEGGLHEGRQEEVQLATAVWGSVHVQEAANIMCSGLQDEHLAVVQWLHGLSEATAADKLKGGVVYMNVAWGRELDAPVPKVVYDKELPQWSSGRSDVIPSDMASLVAKIICLREDIWLGLFDVAAFVNTVEERGSDEAWAELADTLGLQSVSQRGQGLQWEDMTAAYLREYIQPDMGLDMRRLAVIPGLSRAFLQHKRGSGSEEEGSEVDSTEGARFAFTTTVSKKATIATLLCDCGQPAVEEDGTWVCKEACCGFMKAGGANVEGHHTTPKQQALAAHFQLPESFGTKELLDPRPGTRKGRLPGTGPLPLNMKLEQLSTPVRVLELGDLVGAFGPEELHEVLRSTSGQCILRGNRATTIAAVSALPESFASSVPQKKPAVDIRLSKEQWQRYRSLKPTVFFFRNATRAEGMLLKNGDVELLLQWKLMNDSGADCIILVMDIAVQLGLKWKASDVKVLTSVAGEQEALGEVTTPFLVVVAQGTDYQTEVEVGGPDVPVYVIPSSTMFGMLVDQHIMHRLGAMVDPVTQRFHYRPKLWSEGESTIWNSLPGFMYKVPKSSSVGRTHASCAVQVHPGGETEQAEEVLELVCPGVLPDIHQKEDSVETVSFDWDLALYTVSATQLQTMNLCPADRRVLTRALRCFLGDVNQEQPSPAHMMEANLTLFQLERQWRQWLQEQPRLGDRAAWGFPFVGRERLSVQQYTIIACLHPILAALTTRDAMLHSWEEGGEQKLLEWLSHAANVVLTAWEEESTPPLGQSRRQEDARSVWQAREHALYRSEGPYHHTLPEVSNGKKEVAETVEVGMASSGMRLEQMGKEVVSIGRTREKHDVCSGEGHQTRGAKGGQKIRQEGSKEECLQVDTAQAGPVGGACFMGGAFQWPALEKAVEVSLQRKVAVSRGEWELLKDIELFVGLCSVRKKPTESEVEVAHGVMWALERRWSSALERAQLTKGTEATLGFPFTTIHMLNEAEEAELQTLRELLRELMAGVLKPSAPSIQAMTSKLGQWLYKILEGLQEPHEEPTRDEGNYAAAIYVKQLRPEFGVAWWTFEEDSGFVAALGRFTYIDGEDVAWIETVNDWVDGMLAEEPTSWTKMATQSTTAHELLARWGDQVAGEKASHADKGATWGFPFTTAHRRSLPQHVMCTGLARQLRQLMGLEEGGDHWQHFGFLCQIERATTRLLRHYTILASMTSFDLEKQPSEYSVTPQADREPANDDSHVNSVLDGVQLDWEHAVGLVKQALTGLREQPFTRGDSLLLQRALHFFATTAPELPLDDVDDRFLTTVVASLCVRWGQWLRMAPTQGIPKRWGFPFLNQGPLGVEEHQLLSQALPLLHKLHALAFEGWVEEGSTEQQLLQWLITSANLVGQSLYHDDVLESKEGQRGRGFDEADDRGGGCPRQAYRRGKTRKKRHMDRVTQAFRSACKRKRSQNGAGRRARRRKTGQGHQRQTPIPPHVLQARMVGSRRFRQIQPGRRRKTPGFTFKSGEGQAEPVVTVNLLSSQPFWNLDIKVSELMAEGLALTTKSMGSTGKGHVSILCAKEEPLFWVSTSPVACPTFCGKGLPDEELWSEDIGRDKAQSRFSCAAEAMPVEETYEDNNVLEPDTAFKQGNHVFAQLQAAAGGYMYATMPDGEQEVLLHPGYEKDEEHQWIWGNHPDFTPMQRELFKAELIKRRQSFAYSLADLHGYVGVLGDFTIPLEHDQDIRQKPRRMSAKEQEIVEAKCKELLQAGFITPCTSTKYAQNVVVAAKKDEHGNWTDYRFCIDYRPINKVTPADKYPLHLADDLWDRVGNSKFLTKIDMRSGFHNIKVAVEDQPKTAFWWGNRAYMWTRAPFGLKCIANFFQRVMDALITQAGLSHCCVCFVDDLLIFSDDAEQHIKHVCAVLDAVQKAGLKAHPGKSILGAPVVEYLGHNVSSYGIAPTEAKVAAIKAIQPPTNVAQLRSVLGLLSYYRCYVPNFGGTAYPLNDLLKAGTVWKWDLKHTEALETLKTVICTPGRVLRRADPSRPFILHTDWSTTGIGAVLGQLDDEGNEYLVACVSRSLNKHERNYSSPQGEMLAAVWGVKSFRHYLRFTTFTLSTDHQSLQWLVTTKDLTGQYARWALLLQEYDFILVHRPGVTHQNADAVSRMPQDTQVDVTGARLDKEVSTPAAALLACLGWGQESMATYVHAAALQALLLGDTMVVPWTEQDVLEVEGPLVEPTSQQLQDWEKVHEDATTAVQGALVALRGTPVPDPKPLRATRSFRRGTVECNQLCTVCVAQKFFSRAALEGVVLYEPFGGLGAGLEMLLRMGVRVKRYLYSDTCEDARAVITHRIKHLSARYPHLLPPTTAGHLFHFPQNVYQVTSEDFVKAGAAKGDQWIVVAGWECQDLSLAGKGQGLRGRRSRSFFPLVDMLGTLQLLQQDTPPAYIIENTHFQQHANDQVALTDFGIICGMLGAPVVLDAAQFGSYAHRVRNFWTNLADTALIQRAVRDVVRSPQRLLTHILPDHLTPLPVDITDVPPRYVCNRKGEPMRALPCLVAHHCSRAFRDLGPGMLYNRHTHQVVQPDIRIREMAMGYAAGSTAAPGLCDATRQEILGRAMDAYCMQFLYAVCNVLAQAGFGPLQPAIQVDIPMRREQSCQGLGGGPTVQPTTPKPTAAQTVQALPTLGVAEWNKEKWYDMTPMPILRVYACVAIANAEEGKLEDIWDDKATLEFLQHGSLPEEKQERRRIVKRAKHYSMVSGEIKRLMFDGTRRIVPPPARRQELMQQVHEQCGHFGRRRTTHLLAGSYWWQGMVADVAAVVKACTACDRVKATFNIKQPQLHPLPIEGMMYRWGVDLLGPLKCTQRGNIYIMVMVEHFTKWIELAALPSKESQVTAAALLDKVISRYGAPAEVLTDRGTEFEGAFEDLLQKCLVDHRTTSASHPQADGLAERAVQTVKRALRKLSVEKGSIAEWDVDMHWVAMGYRCSVQESTGFSPYALLYGVPPTIPPAIKERLSPTISFDNIDKAAESLRQRASLLKRLCATAAHNLAIAQHRDTLRYAKVRSGGYVPRLLKFKVGDYVYVRQPNHEYTLDAAAQPHILRVHKLGDQGGLKLQGRCGTVVSVHAENCAPCHLQVVDGSVDHSRARPSIHKACEVCAMPDHWEVMLLCKACGRGWHTFCLDPEPEGVPEGDFFCPLCDKSGYKAVQGPREFQDLSKGRNKGKGTDKQLTTMQQREVEECRQLHGRVKVLHSLSRDKGQQVTLLGKLTFLGEELFPKCLQVSWSDGTVEKLDLRAAKRGLQSPEATALEEAAMEAEAAAKANAVAAAVAIRHEGGELPGRWDWHDGHDVSRIMKRLMPGKWEAVHCTRLFNSRPGTAAYVEQVKERQHAKSAVERIKLLMKVVNLKLASCLVDPWGDMMGDRAGAWADAGLRVMRNSHRHMEGFELNGDALQPGWYKDVASRKELGTIVSTPWARNLDIAAPLATRFVSEAVMLEVPVSWVTCAPPARAAWLEELRQEKKLLCIMGTGGLPMLTTPAHWICIFKHQWVREKFVRAAYKDCGDICFLF